MIATAVFVFATVILIAVVATEDPSSPVPASSTWRIIAFLLSLAGFTILSFGLVTLAIMISSGPPRAPEGRFPTFLAGTLCSVIGGVVFGLTVLPSRTVFGRRTMLLAKTALFTALLLFALFAWQQISWRIR